MGYLLLTGATGLLGSYLMRDLLLSEEQVAVIVRADEIAPATRRVEAIMAFWDQSLGQSVPRPVVLEGNITEPELGLDLPTRRWVARHCDRMLHNAASLTFHASDRQSEPWCSNVDGTRNVLELCRASKIRQFHHVSTAFVCGLRAGPNLETELDVGQQWGNDYELSKVEAEKMIRAAQFLDAPTVYRPSIILGDSRTGYTSTFHAFYAPLQLACVLAGKLQHGQLTPQEELPFLSSMSLRGDETKNCVPVDWVSAIIAGIVRRGNLHGSTYHLTNPVPATVGLMQDVICEAILPLVGASSTPAAGFGPNINLETMFRDRLEVYRSYWRDDPIFDCRNTWKAFPNLPCPPVNRQLLLKFAQFAIQAGFGWPRRIAPPPEFDVATRVAGLATSADDSAPAADSCWVSLQVNGPGGGQWRFRLCEGQIHEAEAGVSPADNVRWYLNSATLAEIAQGGLSPQQALDMGYAILDGQAQRRADGFLLLQQFAQQDVSPLLSKVSIG